MRRQRSTIADLVTNMTAIGSHCQLVLSHWLPLVLQTDDLNTVRLEHSSLNLRANDPGEIRVCRVQFAHFFGQTTDASTLHPNDPALKVVCRQTVGRRAYATNVRWFSRLGEPNFVGPQALNLLCQQVV